MHITRTTSTSTPKQSKLATGLVSSVWLQLGTDPGRLRKGLEFLRAEAAGREPPVRVVGSLAVPSRKFLAMMKFRPWGGVQLTEEYLASVESADAVTRRILEVYKEFAGMDGCICIYIHTSEYM